eukprot:scaffold141096_cov24-Tisochrysis_lutea.AAC.2
MHLSAGQHAGDRRRVPTAAEREPLAPHNHQGEVAQALTQSGLSGRSIQGPLRRAAARRAAARPAALHIDAQRTQVFNAARKLCERPGCWQCVGAVRWAFGRVVRAGCTQVVEQHLLVFVCLPVGEAVLRRPPVRRPTRHLLLLLLERLELRAGDAADLAGHERAVARQLQRRHPPHSLSLSP